MFTSFFFFNDTATTEIYTLSLHDALPIFRGRLMASDAPPSYAREALCQADWFHWCIRDPHAVAYRRNVRDRKSTRLNSSHANISYAVFCLKKKKLQQICTKYVMLIYL